MAEESLRAAESEANTLLKQQGRRRKRAERKLVCAEQEIEDLTSEFQREREANLDSLREANRDSAARGSRERFVGYSSSFDDAEWGVDGTQSGVERVSRLCF